MLSDVGVFPGTILAGPLQPGFWLSLQDGDTVVTEPIVTVALINKTDSRNENRSTFEGVTASIYPCSIPEKPYLVPVPVPGPMVTMADPHLRLSEPDQGSIDVHRFIIAASLPEGSDSIKQLFFLRKAIFSLKLAGKARQS